MRDESHLILKKKLLHATFCVYASKPNFNCIEVKQVHGNAILSECTNDSEADGIISNHPIVKPLSIKTADCLPIVIQGKNQSALIHAGWRGVFQKIHLQEVIRAIKPLYAFIGPHIQGTSFQVQQDFKTYFDDQTYLQYYRQHNDQLFFDLSRVVIDDLKKSFPAIRVESSDIDTFVNPLFHSYRRDKTKQRNYNILFDE